MPLVWNLACGFAQNKNQLIAFRFLSGLGGSAPLSVGGGVLGDLWKAEQRGRAVGIYSLAPLLGPAIGPVAGGFIAEKSTWRWVFWSTTIADAVVQLIGIFALQESKSTYLVGGRCGKAYMGTAFAPVLLERKANRLIKQMDAEKGQKRVVRTVFQSDDRT